LTEPSAAADLQAFVREADRDRFLASLFAPAEVRPHLFALYAFNAEIAMIRDRVSAPPPGEMRLQWWREFLAGPRRAEGEGNPVGAALMRAVGFGRLPIEPLMALLDARTFDLYDDPMPSVKDLEGYCGETSSVLIRLASLLLGRGKDLGGAEAAGHAGVAYAVTGLLRALPRHAAQGRCYVPKDVLARHGATPADLLAGRYTPALADALADMRSLARRHLGAAREAMLPKAIGPAFLPAALVEPYLRRMEQPGFDPFRESADVSQWRRQLALWRASQRGI
jgi:phytoene synthase